MGSGHMCSSGDSWHESVLSFVCVDPGVRVRSLSLAAGTFTYHFASPKPKFNADYFSLPRNSKVWMKSPMKSWKISFFYIRVEKKRCSGFGFFFPMNVLFSPVLAEGQKWWGFPEVPDPVTLNIFPPSDSDFCWHSPDLYFFLDSEISEKLSSRGGNEEQRPMGTEPWDSCPPFLQECECSQTSVSP